MEPGCEVRTLKIIGNEIKEWCKNNKITQTELAAALDVSDMTVRRIWKGKKALTSVEIGILMEAMPNVPIEFFIPTDMGGRCVEYAKNLGENRDKDYYTESQQKAINRIKKKFCVEDEENRRLEAAMDAVKSIKDEQKRKLAIQQIELIVKAAGI